MFIEISCCRVDGYSEADKFQHEKGRASIRVWCNNEEGRNEDNGFGWLRDYEQ